MANVFPQSPKRYRMICHECGLATQRPSDLRCDEDDTLTYYLQSQPSHDEECVHAGEGDDSDCRDYPKPSLWTGLVDTAGREVYEFDAVAVPFPTKQGYALGAVLWRPESSGFVWINDYGHHFILAHQVLKGFVVGSVFDSEEQLAAKARELLEVAHV
ncbi:MAG: hypothetical protein CVV27_15315 [Candidatus Melainabacteria bacterium HGW-Melainabacteria-1]|nr:MAG: hypothetical protein CVV27_15315 [Candidatus Melainabacteria bacterium HGW-Melainabacteria-1]